MRLVEGANSGDVKDGQATAGMLVHNVSQSAKKSHAMSVTDEFV